MALEGKPFPEAAMQPYDASIQYFASSSPTENGCRSGRPTDYYALSFRGN